MFGIEDFSKPIVDYTNFDFSQLGDVLLFGGSVLLIGMATIFGVLCILWLCLVLFRVFFHDIPERKAANNILEPTVEIEESYASGDVQNEDEIIAVIAAAIAMAESTSHGSTFRVVSFKRK